jgi:photosystem II stability/assembly factor-like uncharacterized protein
VIEDRVYIAVGGPGCVLRSDNGGRSFSRLSGASGACGGAINQIVVTADPGNDEQEWIWLATEEEGLGRSADGGLSWEFSPAIPMANDLVVFNDGNCVIAVTTEGLYSATNADSANLAGLTWTLVGPAQEGSSDLHSIRRGQDGTIYVVGTVVILISRDDGATFQGLEIPLAAPIVDLALHPSESDIAYISGKGFYKLDLGIEELTALSKDVGAAGVLSLAVDPQYRSLVWAGDWDHYGLAYSLDSGNSWQRVFRRDDDQCTRGECVVTPQAAAHYPVLAVDPTNGCNIFAASRFGSAEYPLLASHDRGRTWTEIGEGEGLATNLVTDVAVHRQDPSVVYASAGMAQRYFGHNLPGQGDPFGLYRSVDGGDTFTRVGAPEGHPEINSIALHPDCVERLWVGTYDAGVWLSDDGGRTFTRVGAETLDLDYIVDIAVDPHRSNVLLAGGNSIYENHWRSAWTGEISLPPPSPAEELNAPRYPERLHRSEDGGQTWTALSMPEYGLENIVFHPTQPGTIYVSTHGPGVWRSTDDGLTWRKWVKACSICKRLAGATTIPSPWPPRPTVRPSTPAAAAAACTGSVAKGRPWRTVYPLAGLTRTAKMGPATRTQTGRSRTATARPTAMTGSRPAGEAEGARVKAAGCAAWA